MKLRLKLKKRIVSLAIFFIFVFQQVAFAVPVSDLSAVRNTDGSVTITWIPGDADDQVTIYRNTNPGDVGRQKVAELSNSGKYVDETVPKNLTYYYWVKTAGILGVWYGPVQVQPLAGEGGLENENETIEEEGGAAERLLALPLVGLTKALEALGLQSIYSLFYGQTGLFTPEEEKEAFIVYIQLQVAAIIALAIVWVILNLNMGRAKNAEERAKRAQSLWDWAFTFILMAFSPLVLYLIWQLMEGLVAFAAWQLPDNDFVKFDTIQTGNVLASAIVNFGLAVLRLTFNYMYLLRKIMIFVCVGLTPLVIWAWSIKKARDSVLLWAGELFSNIMMQPAHALAYMFIIKLMTLPGAESIVNQWWAKIGMVAAIIPVGKFLRNIINQWLYVFGIDEERWAATAAGGLMGSLAAVKGIIGSATSPSAAAGAAASLATAGTATTTAAAAGAAGTGIGEGGTFNFASMAAKAAQTGGAIIGAAAGMPFGKSSSFAKEGAAFAAIGMNHISQAAGYIQEMRHTPAENRPSFISQAAAVAGTTIGGRGLGQALEHVATKTTAATENLIAKTGNTVEKFSDSVFNIKDTVAPKLQTSENQASVGGLKASTFSANNQETAASANIDIQNIDTNIDTSRTGTIEEDRETSISLAGTGYTSESFGNNVNITDRQSPVHETEKPVYNNLDDIHMW